jgi:CBS domain-containing protein
MFAHELMTGQPVVIAHDATLSAAAEMMRIRGVGMLPVVDYMRAHKLVGVITDRDLVVRGLAFGHGGDAKVHEHMTRDPLITVGPETPVKEIAARMARHQVRRLPVLDHSGAVIGIVAQADLAVLVGPTDPSLVERVIEGISRPGALTH